MMKFNIINLCPFLFLWQLGLNWEVGWPWYCWFPLVLLAAQCNWTEWLACQVNSAEVSSFWSWWKKGIVKYWVDVINLILSPNFQVLCRKLGYRTERGTVKMPAMYLLCSKFKFCLKAIHTSEVNKPRSLPSMSNKSARSFVTVGRLNPVYSVPVGRCM